MTLREILGWVFLGLLTLLVLGSCVAFIAAGGGGVTAPPLERP